MRTYKQTPTHRYDSLQTNVKILLLVHLQFLQCHSCFADELIVPKLVFITDGESEAQIFFKKKQILDHTETL